MNFTTQYLMIPLLEMYIFRIITYIQRKQLLANINIMTLENGNYTKFGSKIYSANVWVIFIDRLGLIFLKWQPDKV